MKRVVLDTNVIDSGITSINRPESPPGKLIRRWSRNTVVWCVSLPILEEVRRTLETPYFAARIPEEERASAVLTIETRTEWIELTAFVSGVASHPEDDRILATAVSARAEILVTGDRQLLALGHHEAIRILSVRDALDALLTDH